MASTENIPPSRLDGQFLHVRAAGRTWLLELGEDLDEIWDRLTSIELEDERIPYWVELWPSSLALATFLSQKRDRMAGRAALDLGCGMGFTALVGQYLGAKVLGCDYIPAALEVAAANGRMNNAHPAWIAMDWRAPALAAHSQDLIWAADILYEERAMKPVLDFLEYGLAPSGIAWIAEPGRSIFGHFTVLVHKRGWRMEPAVEFRVPGIKPGDPQARVIIWELEPHGEGD